MAVGLMAAKFAGEGSKMSSSQVHYELFVRRRADTDWALELANEDRAQVVLAADALLAEGAVAVKVCKETLDPFTGAFKSVTILTKGDTQSVKSKKSRETIAPLCVSSDDLYSTFARERIGRLLDVWLQRYKVTPFELLHSPKLLEKLDASGTELQHAIQKIAIPEAQARGVTVHEVIRNFQQLADRVIEKVTKDARSKRLPSLTTESFGDLCTRLHGDPEAPYLISTAITEVLASAQSWRAKIEILLDLADAAPSVVELRNFALSLIEQPMAEVLGSDAGLLDVLGQGLDLGDMLGGMTRIAAVTLVDQLIEVEPRVAAIMPPLSRTGARLANWLDSERFEAARVAVSRQVLREMVGPRRLKPASAEAEIDCLRALAMILTASAGRVLLSEEVQEAFTVRSRMLVASPFVEKLIGGGMSPRHQADALVRLMENVTGAANKREAGRWLTSTIGTLKFERDLRDSTESPTVRLAVLASLQRHVARSGLVVEDYEPIQISLGRIGQAVETDAQLVASISKAQTPVVNRVNMLLRLATGDTGTTGPVAEKARQEILKMLKVSEVRDSMASAPELVRKVRDLVQPPVSVSPLPPIHVKRA